jgi:hypothetical protein
MPLASLFNARVARFLFNARVAVALKRKMAAPRRPPSAASSLSCKIHVEILPERRPALQASSSTMRSFISYPASKKSFRKSSTCQSLMPDRSLYVNLQPFCHVDGTGHKSILKQVERCRFSLYFVLFGILTKIPLHWSLASVLEISDHISQIITIEMLDHENSTFEV